MRLKVESRSPAHLALTLSRPFAEKVMGVVIGTGFAMAGIIFLFSSLPHREIISCERRGGQLVCTSAQIIAGRWTIDGRTLISTEGCISSVAQSQDKDGTSYRGIVEGPGGKLAFGKSEWTPAAVQPAVDRLNAFFADPARVRVEVTEDVWWWWAAVPGALALLLGVLAASSVNNEHWIFDSERAEILRATRPFRLRVHRWPLSLADRAAIVAGHDGEGDPLVELRLHLRSGKSLLVASKSPRAEGARALEGAVPIVNRFLRRTDS